MKCIFCPTDLEKASQPIGKGYSASCPACGEYLFSPEIAPSAENNQLSEAQLANIRGYLHEHPDIIIEKRDLEYLRSLPTPTVHAKSEKLLSYFARSQPKPGTEIVRNEDKKLLHVAWAEDFTEQRFLMDSYIDNEMGWIYQNSNGTLQISPKGWSYYEEQLRGNTGSSSAFVAMYFDEKLIGYYEQAIYRGIEDAGYTPERIDKVEHVKRIDDEIIVRIRQSRFLVVDLTGQRQGVYFEAGFALGLGRPVIWMCNKEELSEVHFDNRQYNLILWSHDNYPDARKRLNNRIRALPEVGVGPNVHSV